MRLWVCRQRVSVVQAQRHIHSLLSERAVGRQPTGMSRGDAVAPDRRRRPVGQHLTRPPMVIERDSPGGTRSSLAAVVVAFEVDVLVLSSCATAAR